MWECCLKRFSCFSLYSHRWKLCQHCLRQPFMTWTILALPTSFSSIQVKTKKQKVYSRLGNDNQVQFWLFGLFGYSNLKYFNFGWDLEYESTRAPKARAKVDTFGIEESREFLCTLQAHYVFCMHLWDVIIHIWSYFKYPSTIKSASISLHFHFLVKFHKKIKIWQRLAAMFVEGCLK